MIPPKPLLVELAQSSAQRIVDGVLENYGKCERGSPTLGRVKLLDDLSVASQFIGTAFGKGLLLCFYLMLRQVRVCRRTFVVLRGLSAR